MKHYEQNHTAKIVILAKGPDALTHLLTMMKVFAEMSGGSIEYQVVENDNPEMEEVDASASGMDGAGDAAIMTDGAADAIVADLSADAAMAELPAALDTPEMRAMLDKLVEAGVLVDGYQLTGQSWTEKSVIAAFLSNKTGNPCMWSAFAKLWGCDKKALQNAYYKHCDTKTARLCYRKLSKVLG